MASHGVALCTSKKKQKKTQTQTQTRNDVALRTDVLVNERTARGAPLLVRVVVVRGREAAVPAGVSVRHQLAETTPVETIRKELRC
jgi:hypothetical protein